MFRWKPLCCVRWWWRLHHRESPDETSHKGDTHAHSYAHSGSLIVTHSQWLITEGFPKLVQWRHLNFHIFKNRFGVSWVDFSISLWACFIIMFGVIGKPCLTFLPRLTFSYFLILSQQCGRVLCLWKEKKIPPPPCLLLHVMNLQWKRKSQCQYVSILQKTCILHIRQPVTSVYIVYVFSPTHLWKIF